VLIFVLVNLKGRGRCGCGISRDHACRLCNQYGHDTHNLYHRFKLNFVLQSLLQHNSIGYPAFYHAPPPTNNQALQPL
jgi:hypothetical protein